MRYCLVAEVLLITLVVLDSIFTNSQSVIMSVDILYSCFLSILYIMLNESSFFN